MEQYEKYRQKHPDWTDEQIWTAISVDMQADKVIEEAGSDIDQNDPDIMEAIIRGAMEWLDAVLPIIFEKVKQFFGNLLSNIGSWVSKGIEYIMELISQPKYF
ncbi:MAG: hypothetical protein K2I69_07500 [Muribaculaceae bacterium]|nr:hypothetical protein [Muribaculaceae bacterium]